MTLNQPKSKNAFNDQQYIDMSSAFELAEDESVSVVIITGMGRMFVLLWALLIFFYVLWNLFCLFYAGEGSFFSSGANLKEFAKEITDEDKEDARQQRQPVHLYAKSLIECQKPIIAGMGVFLSFKTYYSCCLSRKWSCNWCWHHYAAPL
jgi:enoyl-CoA hydratase/carnithine racemase